MCEQQYKVMPIFFLSETIFTIVIKFTYFIGKSSTVWRLFFYKIFFIINTHFQPLYGTLYAGNTKLFTEASEFFTHAVLQVTIVQKNSILEVHPSGGQIDGSQR
jgi:hypothetical protein